MKMPRIPDIIAKLELVLENKLSREEVSDWANKWMMVLEKKKDGRLQITIF